MSKKTEFEKRTQFLADCIRALQTFRDDGELPRPATVLDDFQTEFEVLLEADDLSDIFAESYRLVVHDEVTAAVTRRQQGIIHAVKTGGRTA